MQEYGLKIPEGLAGDSFSSMPCSKLTWNPMSPIVKGV